MDNQAYWTCRIGPAVRDDLPDGADAPLRQAIVKAYNEFIGHHAMIVSSGWGRTESDEAHLGLATTRELLLELKARGEISADLGEYPEEMGSMALGAANLLDTLPGSMLDYRTVDS